MTRSRSPAGTSKQGARVAAPAAETTVQVVIKQRVATDAILADNHRLKEELALETKFSVNPTSQAARQLISNLEAQARRHDSLIVEQQALTEKLLDKQSALQSTIDEQRIAMGGINSALEASIRAQRRVILLENRVEQAAAAKSTAELTSVQIRKKVDGLRRERLLFDELAGKMEKALVERAEEIYDVAKKTSEAHSARSRAESMKAQIREQMERDVAAAEAEWAELTKILDGDRARRAAEQAQREAERSQRMESLLRRQRAVGGIAGARTGKRRGGGGSGAAAEKEQDRRDIKSGGDETEDVVSNVAERVKATEDFLDAVAVGFGSGCRDAHDAAEKLVQMKSLCLSLFASLGEAQGRLESLEERVQALRESRKAVAMVAPTQAAKNNAVENIIHEKQEAGSDPAESARVLAEGRVRGLCGEVDALCQRIRKIFPEMDRALEQGSPTPETLVEFIGLLEHWVTGEAARCGAGLHMTSPWVPGSNDSSDVTLVEPPSVASSDKSSRDGGSASSGGGWRRKGRGRGSRPSANGTGTSERGKVLDLATLAERAQRAVAARLEMATALRIKLNSSLYQFQFQLPRLLALLLTAAVTLQAYRRDWFAWRKDSTTLRRLAAALQAIWLVSELAFLSAFTPILLAYFPALSHPSTAAALALRALPTATMVGLSGCLNFVTGFRQRRRHRRLASIESGELNRLHTADMYTDATATTTTGLGLSTPPMSPADSCSSGSSGGMRSGLPSPTGHCYSPDRLAAHRKQLDDSLGSSEVYLMQHSCSTEMDANDSMLFVHKVLKPIKTRIGEPAPVLAKDYKPLLKNLMAQSGAKHNLTASVPSAYAQPAMEYAPVVATITITKGKGMLNAPLPTVPVVQV